MNISKIDKKLLFICIRVYLPKALPSRYPDPQNATPALPQRYPEPGERSTKIKPGSAATQPHELTHNT